MKRVLFTIYFLVLFVFLTITNVNAAECTTTELRELKNLAKKIQLIYEPKKDIEDNYYFEASIYNMDKKFYLVVDNSMYVMYSSNNMFLGGFKDDINIKVYASNQTNCTDELLDKTTYRVPAYNKYFESKECVGNEDLDVCKKWYDSSKISEEKFKELVNKKPVEAKKKTFFENVISILKQYGLIGLAIIVGIGLIVFAVIFIKNKKRTKIDL